MSIEALEAQLTEDMKTAMRAKDQVRLEAVRSIRAALTTEKTSAANQGSLTEAQAIAVLQRLKKQRVESAEIFSVSRKRVEDLLRRSPELYENWSAYLAVELQNARHRSELLSRKTVAERLSGWIDWNGKLPPRGRWKYVAQEIGVTPEALYREIKKRGDEGG